MAWFNNGEWDNLSSQALTYIIPDVITAINERRSFLGATEIDFDYTDSASLNGVLTTSTNMHGLISDINTNLTSMMNYVDSSAGYTKWRKNQLTDSSGFWDSTSILADVDIYSSLTVPSTANDLNYWYTVKGCLDRMKFPTVGLNSNAATGSVTYTRYQPSTWVYLPDVYTTIKDSTSLLTGNGNGFEIRCQYISGTTFGQYIKKVDFTNWKTADLTGDFVDAFIGVEYSCVKYNGSVRLTSDDIDETISLDNTGSSGLNYMEIPLDSSGINIGSLTTQNTELNMIDIPASYPFYDTVTFGSFTMNILKGSDLATKPTTTRVLLDLTDYLSSG